MRNLNSKLPSLTQTSRLFLEALASERWEIWEQINWYRAHRDVFATPALWHERCTCSWPITSTAALWMDGEPRLTAWRSQSADVSEASSSRTPLERFWPAGRGLLVAVIREVQTLCRKWSDWRLTETLRIILITFIASLKIENLYIQKYYKVNIYSNIK